MVMIFVVYFQPAIREGAVAALRSALVVTAQREIKQKTKPAYYKVNVISIIIIVFCYNP